MKLSLETCASFGGSYGYSEPRYAEPSSTNLAESGEREVVRASSSRPPSIVPAAPGAYATLFDSREVDEMRPHTTEIPEARITEPLPVEVDAAETLPVLPARAPRAPARAHGRRAGRVERAGVPRVVKKKAEVGELPRARTERAAPAADELLTRYPFEGFGAPGFVKAV